ncbi:MAG: hypothetical protein IJ809_01920 [Clostridia bacterium]|nr:hypothetical protein [Clostridia bacterium]
MEKKGALFSALKFIFSTTFLLVLSFAAVVITVMNRYIPTYRVTIGDSFIGYFSNDEEFEDVYNTLIIDKKSVSDTAKVYLEEEPVFEKCYIKNSLISSQNVYSSLGEFVKSEYSIYKVYIEDEEKMVFKNKDDATSKVAEIAAEVPDVETEIKEEKVEEIGEMTSIETAEEIVKDVIEKNKPVVPVVTYNYSSQTTNATVSVDVAAAAAAQRWCMANYCYVYFFTIWI